MRCVKCDKTIAPGASFCASCGARVPAQAAADKKGAPWVAITSVVAGLLLLAGSGYWGYANYAAREDAARKAADAERMTMQPVAQKPAAASPEEAAERAEIVAAQAALSKHILAEEALAKSKAGIR